MSGSFRSRFVASAALFGAAVVQVASAGPPHQLVRRPSIRTVTVETEFPRAGRQFGFGGGRGGVQQDVAIVAQFDADGDGRLDERERHAALPYVESLGLNRGRGGRGVMPLDIEPGPAVSPNK